MSSIQTHLANASKAYSASFTQSELPLNPAENYILITCQDARIDPGRAFGIKLGDAHVIRNSGPSVREALRSIIISQHTMGTREIVVIKHTGCGLMHLTDSDIVEAVAQAAGPEAAQDLRDQNFKFHGGFGNLERAVKEDVAFLKHCKQVLPETVISGWIYDTAKGSVSWVV